MRARRPLISLSTLGMVISLVEVCYRLELGTYKWEG